MEEKPDMFSEVPEGAATLVVELCSALARGFYTAYPLFACYACNGGGSGRRRAAGTARCMCPPSVVNEGAMVYNDFTLDTLIAQFSLQVQEESHYFTLFAPLPISDLLRQTISTEKARSEFI